MNHWQKYNANPQEKRVGDCTIRAISKATDQAWDKVYMDLCLQGYMMADMPSANHVWGEYLRGRGFRREIPDGGECTIHNLCEQNPKGIMLAATNGHIVAIMNGTYYDTWDSGDEIVLYIWRKEEE